MDHEDSITHLDFTNLLASGAFVREPLDQNPESKSRILVMWGPFQKIKQPNTLEISISCVNFYDSSPAEFLRPQKAAWMDAAELKNLCARFIDEISEVDESIEWIEPELSDYESAFAKTQNLIQQEQIDKAVPVVFARSRAKMTDRRKAQWIFEILDSPSSLIAYGFWDQNTGMIGATPEILFEIHGREMKTMALAGTLAKADGTATELLRSTKDQAEHKYVVDDLKQELSRIGKSVVIGDTKIIELPALWHLQTHLQTELREAPEIQDIIRQLHPTPALGVSPRTFGWRWMSELPGQQDRAFFGAPLTVVMGHEKVLSLVTIRNIQWNSSGLLLGSGGGVVKDSRLDSEWNELARKRQSVLKLFGMLK